MSRGLIALTAAFALSAVSVAFSQSNPSDPSTNTNPSGNVTQPQGKTGPLNTKSGGAPASSPQGKRHRVCNQPRKVRIKRFELMARMFQKGRRKNDASVTLAAPRFDE